MPRTFDSSDIRDCFRRIVSLQPLADTIYSRWHGSDLDADETDLNAVYVLRDADWNFSLVSDRLTQILEDVLVDQPAHRRASVLSALNRLACAVDAGVYV